jgi:hypothetical protein
MTSSSNALPRADRSGAYRIVDLEIGDMRQTIAAIGGIATFARAASVGPRALMELLPELQAACAAVPELVTRALVPACDVISLATGMPSETRGALESIVESSRAAVAPVLDVIGTVGVRTPGARSRIALQRSCESAVDALARARSSIELLQRASLGEPLTVSVDELLADLEQADVGRVVYLDVSGAIDAAVHVQPHVASALLLGVLACVAESPRTDALSLRAQREGHRVALCIGPASPDDGAFRIATRVPTLAAHDRQVLTLAAASLAAEVHLDATSATLRFQSELV